VKYSFQRLKPCDTNKNDVWEEESHGPLEPVKRYCGMTTSNALNSKLNACASN
jgi:hypothetical protein